MAFQDTRFGAAVKLKCARCRMGDMFINKNAYRLSKLGAMYKRCPRCGQIYEPEAGFYYGAMFLSYAIGVVTSFIVFCILYFMFKLDTMSGFIAIVVWMLGISPYLFRFSRALWLSFFVNHHKDI
jgi:uncharacterized C2H2 Zn-finger protein